MVKEMEQAFEGQDQDETEPAAATEPQRDIENNNDGGSSDIVSAADGESENEN